MAIGLFMTSVRHESGQPAKLRTLTVKTSLGALAALWQDVNGTISRSNPVTTDELGNIQFYAEEGSYRFEVDGKSINFEVLEAPQGGGAAPYVHSQTVAAATWTVVHNRGTKPEVVTEMDLFPNERVYGDVSYPDLNTAIIEWPTAVTGKAYIS